MPNTLPHRFIPGDIVGIVSDCMADCEIVRRVRKQPGQALLYVAKAVKIHHPRPEESFFGRTKQFVVRERNIFVLLKKAGAR